MKIVCVILGTRGDVQPMVALATGLMRKGHEVTIFAPPENEELVRLYNCRFEPFGPSIKKAVGEGLKNRREALQLQFHQKRERSLSEIR